MLRVTSGALPTLVGLRGRRWRPVPKSLSHHDLILWFSRHLLFLSSPGLRGWSLPLMHECSVMSMAYGGLWYSILACFLAVFTRSIPASYCRKCGTVIVQPCLLLRVCESKPETPRISSRYLRDPSSLCQGVNRQVWGSVSPGFRSEAAVVADYTLSKVCKASRDKLLVTIVALLCVMVRGTNVPGESSRLETSDVLLWARRKHDMLLSCCCILRLWPRWV